MKNRNDIGADHWMKVGLGVSVAGAAVVLSLLVTGTIRPAQGDGPVASVQLAAQSPARTVRPLASIAAARTPEGSSYHGAPFVTDAGGGEPGPLMQ
jgi:hypothetical protein